MATRTVKRSKSATSGGGGKGLDGYLAQSRRPLVILAFLLPFIVISGIGVRTFGVEVAAGTLLRMMVGKFGIYGSAVPAALVILTLLIWHLIEHDRWNVSLKTLLYMVLESILFALPVFGIGMLCRQALPLTTGLAKQSLVAMWCLSLGAGVYEELLFRLFLCGTLYVMCFRGLGLKPRMSAVISILLSSVLFSLYHYMGSEHFHLFTFVFRTFAGVYFACLFSVRGFGITAVSHAFYDVIVVTLAGG